MFKMLHVYNFTTFYNIIYTLYIVHPTNLQLYTMGESIPLFNILYEI